MDITELLPHMHMGGHCICVLTGFASVTLVCIHVCGILLQDLCEVVGSIVRNGPIGHLLQETQNWHGLQVLGDLGLLAPTADDRRTQFSGSLGRQHIRHHIKFPIRGSTEFQHTQDTQDV